jgi:hypothetical protein
MTIFVWRIATKFDRKKWYQNTPGIIIVVILSSNR